MYLRTLLVGIFLFVLFPRLALADSQLGSEPNQQLTPNKRIVIDLSQQSLLAYNGDLIYLQTPVTTGGPNTPTPTGTFKVLSKPHNFTMKSPWSKPDWRWYPDSYVKYGLRFLGSSYYIHDASWRSNFGLGSNSVLGVPGGNFTGTHGCVNVPLAAESTLYNWANVGTPVIIQP